MTLFSIQVTCREHEAELAAAEPAADAQQQRVRQLYQRQLLVPLADADQTLQSYREWEAQLSGAAQPVHIPDHVEKGFKKAQQAVNLRSEHEAMVAPDKPADETLLAAFLAYIKYEQVCEMATGYDLISLLLCMFWVVRPAETLPSNTNLVMLTVMAELLCGGVLHSRSSAIGPLCR